MVIHFWSYGFYLFCCPVSVIWPWVDFINGFAPLRPTFAPFAQLLRSFLMAQMLGAGRERSAQGAKQFMKLTPGLFRLEPGLFGIKIYYQNSSIFLWNLQNCTSMLTPFKVHLGHWNPSLRVACTTGVQSFNCFLCTQKQDQFKTVFKYCNNRSFHLWFALYSKSNL